MDRFTITQLKKILDQKTKKELISDISDLCKKFPQVKEYYKANCFDSIDVFRKYANIIENEFVDGKTKGFPKARISVANKAIQDFTKITADPLLLGDLMLTYVEIISKFSSDFGVEDEKYYTAPENMFEKALKLLKTNELLPKFEKRAYRIVENACEAWGHFDSLQELFEEFYGEFVK